MKNIFSHYSQFCLFILIKGLLGIKDDDFFSLYWPKLKVLSYNIWGMPELFNWYIDLRGYPKVEYKDERIQDLGGLDVF